MMQERFDLSDPERLWRRVFSCDVTGRNVKLYTRRVDEGFGPLVWRITASECDANGDTLRIGDTPRVLLAPNGEPLSHLVQHALETEVATAALLDGERLAFAERVQRLAIIFDEAAAAT